MVRDKFRGASSSEPIRLGIVVNPRSRWNRRHKWLRTAQRLIGHERVVMTRSTDAIGDALSCLLHEQRCNVLGICGGDGTLHHTLNALLSEQFVSPGGESVVLPPILLLRGGTLNMIAQAISMRDDPTKAVKAFLESFQNRSLSSLGVRTVPLLRVGKGVEQRFGFILGSELTARCLDLYEAQFGGGYRGLARFLGAVAVAFLGKTSLWEQHRYLFDGPPLQLSYTSAGASGGCFDVSLPVRAAVASTVDITLFEGRVVGMHVTNPKPGTMQLRVLEDRPAAQIMAQIPRLLIGQGGDGILDVASVSHCEVTRCDYSLDGEVFSMSEDMGTLEVTSPAWGVPFVSM
jgi:hypothetical protein